MNNEKKKLNKEQLEAVKHKKGPLLIIAGAGTGKTTVITERIKFLIEKDLTKPSEILALTFTEKAAREMEERVDIAMPYGYTQMWISTFHSFCDRILRAEALHIGLDPRYKLMTEAETVQFIRKHLFDLPAQPGFDLDYFRPLGNPTKFIGGMLQHFSRLQDEDVMPNQYLDWVNSKFEIRNSKLSEERVELSKWRELATAYKKYDELKVKEGMMDFGDLIVKTLQLFRQRPNVLGQYQKQFKHILVDEFQDTNVAQYEMLKLLAPPKNNVNLTVVGDDSQSIYKFRGAAVSNILYFKKDYKKAKTILLTTNYRSTQTILDNAYKLIQHNNPDTLESKLGIDKNLVSVKDPKSGEPVKFIHKDRVENEAEEVAKEIGRLVHSTSEGSKAVSEVLQSDSSDGGYNWKDIAILVRANSHAEAFVRALSRNGIPYQFLGPGRLFKQPEIVDLISYLKILYNFEDSVSFYRVLSMDHFDIPARELARIGNYSRRYNLSLFDACEKVDDIFVNIETKEKIKKLMKLVDKHLKLVRKETAGQILYYFLESTGLIQDFINPDSAEAEKRIANISKFFDKLKTYEVDHEDATILAVVDWIELSCELGESPLAADTDWTQVNAVNILTVHSAKGLEFPIVFLVNLVGQRFPTIERKEQIPIPEELIKEVLPQGDYHLQEERRLFYVGMTRAMDLLYFTAADYYGEGKREKKLSPFVFETIGDDALFAEQSQKRAEQLSFLDYKPAEIDLQPTTHNLQPIHIDYLSYSQIETFRICPLHYKLRYILKIPTPPSAAQSFGTSIHAAIREFYDLVKSGKKSGEKLIIECLADSWVKEGFSSKKHEQQFFEKGKIYLAGFFKEGFNPDNFPVLMEESFTIPLSSGSKQKVLGTRLLRIGGRIDRVDTFADGSIEIIDYKTGATIPSQGEVDKNLQLSFYALAATRIQNAPFVKDPKQVKLSLYFLDQQEKLSSTKTEKQLENAVSEIFTVREEIENSDFKCSGHMFCQNCEYSLFCRADE